MQKEQDKCLDGFQNFTLPNTKQAIYEIDPINQCLYHLKIVWVFFKSYNKSKAFINTISPIYRIPA